MRNRRFQFWKRAQFNATRANDVFEAAPSADASPEATALAREQLRAIWKATENLPGRQREVFVLRFVEDMDLTEIAQVLGMKEGTVKSHLFRALHAVREQMRRLP
jgi:RNA polymerase sigma-70 factor (ECF subfamily)